MAADVRNVGRIPWRPGLRVWDVQQLRDAVGLTLVPARSNRRPVGCRHAKVFGKGVPVAGERGDGFVASREQDPAVRSELLAGDLESSEGGVVLAQVRYLQEVLHVP